MAENKMTINEVNEEIKKLNTAISDEDMAKASGGGDSPIGTPRFKVGDKVRCNKPAWDEVLGEGRILSCEWIVITWCYDVYFPKINENREKMMEKYFSKV